MKGLKTESIEFSCGAHARMIAHANEVTYNGGILQWWETPDFITVKLDGNVFLAGSNAEEIDSKIKKHYGRE